MGLDQLQYLNISRNKITIMEKDCFSGVNNLINMDISSFESEKNAPASKVFRK
jgi:Leucine-rich repeat (LRR) protein